MSHLDKLLQLRGVSDSYYSCNGELIEVARECRLNLLRTMGENIDDPQAVDEAIYQIEVQPWLEWLKPINVVSDAQIYFDINITVEAISTQLLWCLILESGEKVTGSLDPQQLEQVDEAGFDGIAYTRRRYVLKDVPLGYHQLIISDGQRSMSGQFIVTPETSYQPTWSQQNQRLFGLIVQLYTLRSERNWGIGDFADLHDLVVMAGEQGVDVIGLNPLHALSANIESNISPYSPSDRRFLNPLYIAIEQLEDYTQSIERITATLPDYQNEAAKLRELDLVNYAAVKQLKYSIFEVCYDHFVEHELSNQESERTLSFKAFQKQRGESLEQFCAYEILKNRWQSQYWDFDSIVMKLDIEPADILSSSNVARIIESNSKLAMFHAYLQWLGEAQLEQCQALSQAQGMRVGLVRDLAVGADREGSEVLNNATLFCTDVSVGAPPDPFAEFGQNWGLPPMHPFKLQQTQYQHFIELMRNNMSACGALRIDHVMGLLRLWWCPPQASADQGAYVYYQMQDLLRLLCLESVRNECVIIGEDMGTVPQELREAMNSAKIFTNKVMYFEKGSDQQFIKTEHYPPKSLVMVANHDVPTLAAWWNGNDLALREELNLFPVNYTYEQAIAERDTDKDQLLDWLVNASVLSYEDKQHCLNNKLNSVLRDIILKHMSYCSSQLFVIQLEDLLMMEAPVNVPGTNDEYINWQRKLVATNQQIFADSQTIDLLHSLASARN